MTDAQHVIILAGTHAQGMDYCREHKLSPIGKYLRIPTQSYHLAGIRGATVHRVGTWRTLDRALLEAATLAERTP